MTDLRVLSTCAALIAASAPGVAFAHAEGHAQGLAGMDVATTTVSCTLENGAETTCYKITVGYLPDGLDIGPFCPATLDDAGGIWDWDGENAGLYRVDGDFLRMLDSLGYRFFDDDGNVFSVDAATRQPDVDHACINVSPDETVMITMLVPTDPVMADAPTPLGVVSKIGVSLDGVPIFSDAPSVQQTGHMPALDTCGGHIDPGGWYHWHATSTDIDTVFEHEHVDADCSLAQDSTALFGYAFDGFPIYGSTETDGSAPAGLDDCGGHLAEQGYHYHAATTFPNLPTCLVGVVAVDNFSTTAKAGVGATQTDGTRNEPPRPGGQVPPGFEDAASTLGIAPDVLMQALDAAGGPRADLDVAAAALGIDPAQLRAALPQPPRQ